MSIFLNCEEGAEVCCEEMETRAARELAYTAYCVQATNEARFLRLATAQQFCEYLSQSAS